MCTLKSFHCILAIAVCLLLTTRLTGQTVMLPPAHTIEHYGEDDGLPQNTISSILPDKNGFLWIATESGICRFNGNRFLPVRTRQGMLNKNFTRIKNFYYQGRDTILAFSPASNQVGMVVNNKIELIERPRYDKHGIFFLNSDHTVAFPSLLLQRSTPGFENLVKSWKLGNGGFEGGVYSGDTIAVSVNAGIDFYNNAGLVSTIPVPDYNSILYLKGKVIHVDKENYMNYYGPQGLIKRQLIPGMRGKTLTVYGNRLADNFFCVENSILYRLWWDSAGEPRVEKLLNNLQNGEEISAIHEKDNNTIVVGTRRNGLYVYKKQFFLPSQPLPGNEEDAFYVQQLLSDNETVLTGKEHTFKNGVYQGSIGPHISYEYSTIKDSKGYYWYISGRQLLKATTIGVDPQLMLTLDGYPGPLFEDRDSSIIMAVENRLHIFKKGTLHVPSGKKLEGTITYIAQDYSGKYWLGTGNGLYTAGNLPDAAVEEVPALKSLVVRFIWPEENGDTWVCTYGNGLFLVNDKKAVQFPESLGRLAFIHSITEDKNGYFWMPTNNGLFVTTRQALLDFTHDAGKVPFYYHFTRASGLRTNEFNGGTQPAFLQLPNGHISFATMKGLLQFNPAEVDFGFSKSPILVDHIYSDSIEITEGNNFDIGSHANNIRFSVSTSFWGGKANDRLEYRIINRETSPDSSWLAVDASGDINLFIPSHGDYQLVIRKRTGMGEQDFLYKIVSFHVLPKWFQTNAFNLAAILGIILALAGIFFWRRRYYRRSNLLLKQKVDAATIELQQMNNTLENKVQDRTREIQEAEIKFRTLVERSLVGVYIVQDDKLLYVNPRFEEILGYNNGELLNTDPTLIIAENERQLLEGKIREQLAGENETMHYEIAGLKKDGTVLQLEIFGSKAIYEGKVTLIGTLIDITSRKMAEDELIKEKDLSLSIINNLPGIFYIFDEDGKYLFWNKNFETVTGYTAVELSKKTAGRCVAPQDIPLLDAMIKNIFANGYSDVEAGLLVKDGSIIPYYFNGITINYHNKICVMGVGIDISERKKAEQEREQASYMLNERIKELTTLYKAGLLLQKEERSVFITLYDFVSITPGGWQYPEIAAACITLGEMEFATPGFTRTKWHQTAGFTTPKGNLGKIEVVYLEERPDADEGPFSAEERNLLDMLADMLRVYFTRREAIEALQKSEANLSTIFDTTDTVYALLDVNFKVIAYNQRAADFSKRELKSNIRSHTSLVEYFPEERRERFLDNLKDVLQGRHVNYEVSYPQKDGTLNWYHTRMFPIKHADQTVFGIMVAVSDFTEKKNLEQAILDQKVQEQKAVTRAILTGEERERHKIGQELHDNIGQILAGTRLYLSTAKNAKAGSENIITESMQLIDSALEEIRSLSREKVTPTVKVNLNELLQALLQRLGGTPDFKVHFDYRGADLEIADDLKLNIYRIIQELMSNIIKHAGAKNVYATIEAGESNIHVLIKDDGKGFDISSRRDGIGLANIVNRVESFNGSISIETSPGEGCTTEINLPLKQC